MQKIEIYTKVGSVCTLNFIVNTSNVLRCKQNVATAPGLFFSAYGLVGHSGDGEDNADATFPAE